MQAQQKLFTKLYLPLLKSFHNAVSIKVRHFLARPLLPCFHTFPLFSFQGAIPAEAVVENSGIEPLTS